MSQQAGSSGPMLNVPYAYFYGGNVMPGSFQYGTPAIYPVNSVQTDIQRILLIYYFEFLYSKFLLLILLQVGNSPNLRTTQGMVQPTMMLYHKLHKTIPTKHTLQV